MHLGQDLLFEHKNRVGVCMLSLSTWSMYAVGITDSIDIKENNVGLH